MNKYNTAYWLETLCYFDKNGYIQNGLTLPFLVGANSFLSPNDDNFDVRSLLVQLINDEVSMPVTIQKCGGIREYVIGLLDPETIRMQKRYKQSNRSLYLEYGQLKIVDNSFQKENSIESIIETL